MDCCCIRTCKIVIYVEIDPLDALETCLVGYVL